MLLLHFAPDIMLAVFLGHCWVVLATSTLDLGSPVTLAFEFNEILLLAHKNILAVTIFVLFISTLAVRWLTLDFWALLLACMFGAGPSGTLIALSKFDSRRWRKKFIQAFLLVGV